MSLRSSIRRLRTAPEGRLGHGPSKRAPSRSVAVFVSTAALLVMASGCAIPRWPVNAPVSSDWGVRWRGWLPEVHRGVDLVVPEGTPVRAMSGGTVAFAGRQAGFGNAVWIDHGGSVYTLYAHLSRIDTSVGRRVGPGQVVGLSGQTGDVTGPHLHFEIWRWGRPVDPVPLLGGYPGR